MKFKLVEIKKIDSYKANNEVVHDLTVEDNHSYCVQDDIIVHNSGCETRPKTGVGYPQLSCVLECAEAAHGLKAFVCSDGGCVYPGDLAKAFGAGADFVMLGGMLAGHKECSSETEFFGMSSETAMNKFNGGVADYKTSEGRSVKLEPRGNVEKTLLDIQGGLRSACTYVGAEKLKHLGKCTTFLKVNRTHNKVFEGK